MGITGLIKKLESHAPKFAPITKLHICVSSFLCKDDIEG